MSIAANSNIAISGFIDPSRVHFKAEKKGRKNLDLPNDKSRLLAAISFTVWMLHFNHSHNIIQAFHNLYVIYEKYHHIFSPTSVFPLRWGRTDHKNKETVGIPTNKQASSLQITRSRTDTDPSDLSNCLGCGFNEAWNVRDVFCVAWWTWQCRIFPWRSFRFAVLNTNAGWNKKKDQLRNISQWE